MNGFLAIDGAFLLDPRGTCHAVGCILDGPAHLLADRARGSRYNSTLRYVQAQSKCLAVVYSEDGHVNCLSTKQKAVGVKAKLGEISKLTDDFRSVDDVQLREPWFDEETGEHDDGRGVTDFVRLGQLLAEMPAWKRELTKGQLEKLLEVVGKINPEDSCLVDLPVVRAELESELASRAGRGRTS